MIELFHKGGWVMYPLLACSVLTVAIGIERLLYFFRIRNKDETLLHAFSERINEMDFDACASFCKEHNGPIAALIANCIANMEHGSDYLEELIEHEGARFLADMERHLRTLAIIAQTAPLMGLLGTVTGMIAAFMNVEQATGRVGASALAGGIWEALLTTAFGLVVAIPAMLLYHFFEGRVDDYEKKIHRAAHIITASLARRAQS